MARVEPRSISIEEMGSQIRTGKWRVPRFQRGFVWRRDQVIALFDSVRLRYPIGSLLLWRTPQRYESFDHIGAVRVPINEPAQPATVGYVLDGHQRLSALFGALGLDKVSAENLNGSDRIFLVFLDLEEERFVHVRSPKAHHLPVWKFFHEDHTVLEHVDRVRDKTESGSPERKRWDRYHRAALKTQIGFAQYLIPYIDVQDADLVEAREIFTRVNSHGTRMSWPDVFSALTWKPGYFDFSQSAKALLQSHPRYANVGVKPVLRALFLALGEDLYTKDGYDTLEKKYKEVLAHKMEQVAIAFDLAVDFMGATFGVNSGKVLPYALQLILVTEFFRNCPKPGARQVSQLTNWFWATSFSAAYASATSTTVEPALKSIRSLALDGAVELPPRDAHLRPFPRNFHPKAARVRAVHLFLATLNPMPLQSSTPFGGTMLSNGMVDAQVICGIPGSPLRQRLANRLLVGPGRYDLVAELVALKSHPNCDHILESHAIPLHALECLCRGDEDGFVDGREAEIIRLERQFASSHVRVPKVPQTEDDAEIDVDNETETDLI